MGKDINHVAFGKFVTSLIQKLKVLGLKNQISTNTYLIFHRATNRYYMKSD